MTIAVQITRDLFSPRKHLKEVSIMPTKKPDEIVNRRSSETGRFVTEEYVKKHPKKTQTEHNLVHNPPATPAKKK